MNKIEKVLLDSAKKLEGNILGFGNLSEKVIETIDKNTKITEFILLSDKSLPTSDGKGRSSKRIPYKKIRKKFRKKNITTIIASYDELEKYHRRFISDSLYLVKKEIYLYIKNEDIDVDIIKKRFARYHQDLEEIACKDGTLLKITKTNYKKNKARDSWYLFMNFIGDGINYIGDLFVS